MTSPSWEYTKKDWINDVTAIKDVDLDNIEEGLRQASILKAQSVLFAKKSSGGVWPSRPTSRADVLVLWIGPDPSPPVVASGTSGMLAGDERHLTP